MTFWLVTGSFDFRSLRLIGSISQGNEEGNEYIELQRQDREAMLRLEECPRTSRDALHAISQEDSTRT